MFKTVSQEVKLKRLQICFKCSDYLQPIKTCKLCKCYVPAKTMFSSAECPAGNWKEDAAGSNLENEIEEAILKIWDNS
jgi:hypothetical protein